MKQIILDTNIAIEILNGRKETLDWIKNFDLICLPVIVCGELLFGANNSKSKKANIEKFTDFINSAVVLNTNSLVAREYAEIRLQLKTKGTPIPENDIWIAAICKLFDIPLATKDITLSILKGLYWNQFNGQLQQPLQLKKPTKTRRP